MAVVRQNRPAEGKSYAQRATEIYSRLRSPDLKVALEALMECENIIRLEAEEHQQKVKELQEKQRKAKELQQKSSNK